MYRALVIGCGNIGAGYDINNNQVQTHVKAFHLDPRFSLSIFDIDNSIAKKISNIYSCDIADNINETIIQTYDCVSICTTTDSHFSLLKMAIDAGVKVIICEKPISNKFNELNDSKYGYLNGKSKVLVNYIRRFQPAFIDLKKIVCQFINKEKLTNINIRYQRGFINNCSHALDLIEFLTGTEINLEKIKTHNKIFDHFKNDPTLSLQALWNGTNITIIGLSNVCFSIFEIDLYFEIHKVSIKNAGQNIEIYKSDRGGSFLLPLYIQDQFSRNDCLKNYMANVIDKAHKILSDNEEKDNFLEALSLNKKMLNYINV